MNTSLKELASMSKQWATELPHTWEGIVNGVDFDANSPTHETETLGQTICRIGDDLYRESLQPGTGHGNEATVQECADLTEKFPQAKAWFDLAVGEGFKARSAIESPFEQLISELTGTAATHPVGDVNPRYSNLVGDVVGSAGGPVMGRVSSTQYSGRRGSNIDDE